MGGLLNLLSATGGKVSSSGRLGGRTEMSRLAQPNEPSRSIPINPSPSRHPRMHLSRTSDRISTVPVPEPGELYPRRGKGQDLSVFGFRFSVFGKEQTRSSFPKTEN